MIGSMVPRAGSAGLCALAHGGRSCRDPRHTSADGGAMFLACAMQRRGSWSPWRSARSSSPRVRSPPPTSRPPARPGTPPWTPPPCRRRTSWTSTPRSSTTPASSTCTSPTGPLDVQPGQNNIEFSGKKVPKPDVDGYIVRIQPNLRHADGTVPRRRRHPPAPRRLAQRLGQGRHLGAARALLRRRRGEDRSSPCPRATATPYKATDNWAHQLHDPQPHADRRPGVDHLRHRLHPGRPRRRPQGIKARPARSGWTSRTASPTRCSTSSRARATNGQFTYPKDAATRTTAAKTTPGPSTATACSSAPAATCTPAACTTTCTSPAPAHRPRPARPPPARSRATPPTCSSRRPTTTSPRARCRGTSP